MHTCLHTFINKQTTSPSVHVQFQVTVYIRMMFPKIDFRFAGFFVATSALPALSFDRDTISHGHVTSLNSENNRSYL